MGKKTGISWTNHTFNPYWGCTKISEGCQHCYAEVFSHRLGQDIWGPGKPRREFDDKHWNEPLNWSRRLLVDHPGVRETVFCGSMMDWCDPEAPKGVLERMWNLIFETRKNLVWLMLTKRPDRIKECLPSNWNPKKLHFNVVLGTTIELDKYAWRADAIRDVPAFARFISAEPLLGPVPSLKLHDIDWLIVGGESGTDWREMKKEWATDLRDRCQETNTTFFYKQSNGQFSGKDPWLEVDGQKVEYHHWPKKFRLALKLVH